MNSEINTSMQADIELLRTQIGDTKSLYREVCALMFFRYGITPTTNKLYQSVKKGSMSVPTEVLSQFWQDLRKRAKVEIEHPEVPVEVLQATGKVIHQLWRMAQEHAHAELDPLRQEAQAEVASMRGLVDEAQTRVRQAQADTDLWQQRHDALLPQMQATQDALAKEKNVSARLQAQVDELHRQMLESRADVALQRQSFAEELDKSRSAIAKVQSQAEATEHRALLQMDQSRQAQAKLEKQLGTLRQQSALSEQQWQQRHLALSQELMTSQATHRETMRAGEISRQQTEEALKQLAQLESKCQTLQHSSLQYETEAQTLRTLLATLGSSTTRVPQRRRRMAARPK